MVGYHAVEPQQARLASTVIVIDHEQFAGLRQCGALDLLQPVIVFHQQIADQRLGQDRGLMPAGAGLIPATETR